MITLECPNCGKKVKTEKTRAGKTGKCPRCGEKFVIPSALAEDEIVVADEEELTDTIFVDEKDIEDFEQAVETQETNNKIDDFVKCFVPKKIDQLTQRELAQRKVVSCFLLIALGCLWWLWPKSEVEMNDLSTGIVRDGKAMVRVDVYDDTENNPLPARAEIWFRNHGSFFIKNFLVFDECSHNLAHRSIEVRDTIHIYPDARDGKEITVSLVMTDEMDSRPDGNPLDAITVAISDTEVKVSGLPIKAANGESELIFKR